MFKRILVWIGSRANYGRLKKLLDVLKAEHNIYVITGDYDLPDTGNNQMVIVGKVPNLLYYDTRTNMARSVSLVTQAVATIIDSSKPYDLAIVHGDRYENLGFATACSLSGIPLLHTEGGEITGQIDNKIRYAITELSDFHCTPTQLSCDRLRLIGHRAFNTGSPAIDFVSQLSHGKVPVKNSFVFALYNPSDVDEWVQFTSAISDISCCANVICITPNYDPGWREITKRLHSMSQVVTLSTVEPKEFYGMMRRCRCFVGNSSAGIKEGAYLGIPYILVGNRQNGREVGPNVLRVPCQTRDIVNAVLGTPEGTRYKYNGLFGNGYAAENIAKVIREEVFEGE